MLKDKKYIVTAVNPALSMKPLRLQVATVPLDQSPPGVPVGVAKGPVMTARD
jgi:hypothetical protein